MAIEIINDPGYSPQSSDNLRAYEMVHSHDSDQYFSSKHGIIVSRNEKEICSAIILCAGGATGINEKSAIIKNGLIFICCGNSVCSLRLTNLTFNWLIEIDVATCFGIYEFENDFVIHGEMEISRITEEGKIVWQFSGRDIFVNIHGEREFEIIGDQIKLVDFLNNNYFLDKNGQEI
ncbi:MAG: hypothetical protein M3O71_24185 [Bacteroidota bacterium]|nr:hypothetical protein [Bacteroidota bacterium]